MDAALIVFARVPGEGSLKTRLASLLDEGQRTILYRAFLRDTILQTRRAGVPVRWYLHPGVEGFDEEVHPGSIHPQAGNTLGERMQQAFEETRETGARRVAILGTDAPSLPPQVLLEAYERLVEPRSAVLGPAEDGGYYLLGLNALDTGFLSQMEYSRPDVLRKTERALLSQTASVSRLRTWYDVDMPEDLKRLRGEVVLHPERAPNTARLLLDPEWTRLLGEGAPAKVSLKR